MRAETLLSMDGVHKWYRNFHALDNCSLGVARGEKIVVCGPSGSGKSTLIRCVNRIEQHDRGRIAFKGVTLDDSRKAVDARKARARRWTRARASAWCSSRSTCSRTRRWSTT